ncbi:hypothetical protein Tco_1168007, partial [Tanacetum coccineum]
SFSVNGSEKCVAAVRGSDSGGGGCGGGGVFRWNDGILGNGFLPVSLNVNGCDSGGGG